MQAQNLPTGLDTDNADSIDLAHYWRIVRQSWKGVLGLCLIVSVLTALSVMRKVPLYTATTTIMIESQQPSTVSIQEVYNPYRNYQYFATQFEIIKNRDIAQLTADRLDLWDNPSFVPKPQASDATPEPGFLSRLKTWISGLITTPASRAKTQRETTTDPAELHRLAVVSKILAGLSVRQREYTQLGTISFTSTDRNMAAKIANAVAEVYIQAQIDSKMATTQEAGQWLSSRLGDLKARLDASQQALQEFRDREQILEMSDGQTLGVQELNDLNSLLSNARRQRMETEIIYQELNNTSSYSATDLMSMPTALQHPLVQSLSTSLTEAQQDVANLGKRYGPEHPKMITAEARQESIEAELGEQLDQVASIVGAEYRLARQNEQQLAAQVAAAKEEVADLNRKEFRLEELERQVETDQRLYELFFTRERETAETLGYQSAHARIVERAVPPVSPASQNQGRSILMAFIMSAFAGMGLAILRDAIDNTLRTTDDVLDRLHAPLLGALPNVKLNKKAKDLPYLGYFDDSTSNFAEAVRSVRTGLVLSGLEKPHKITVVTSTNPGEGKSTVALNLAASLAQMESVLLIDADLRRPSIANSLALPKGCPGLTDALAKSDAVDNCIHKSRADFDALPSGLLPSNPQELLSTARFKALVKSLAQRYDRVIIDSAPLNMVSDSLILATLADSLVYVTRADSTPHRLAKKNINLIKNSNLPLTGVVLNRLDINKQRSYGYGIHGYYNQSYGYGVKQKA